MTIKCQVPNVGILVPKSVEHIHIVMCQQIHPMEGLNLSKALPVKWTNPFYHWDVCDKQQELF